MIISGYAMEQGGMDFRLQHQQRGIENIRNFPTLHSILGDFPNFDIQHYDNNPFLNLASRAMYDVFSNGPSESANSTLQSLEILMSELFQRYPDDQDRGRLISDMESFETGQSQRKFTELKTLLEFRDIESIDEVMYEVIPDSSHDYRISIAGTEINIELSALGETESNRSIREALHEVTLELLPLIEDNKKLNIQIAVDRIRLTNGAIDKNHIKTLLLTKIRRVFPIIISDESTWNIETTITQCDGNLLDNIKVIRHYGRWGNRLDRLMSTDEGKCVLRDINVSEFRDFPVTYFDYRSGRFKLIELRTQSFYPSDAAFTRQEEILLQLGRRITKKLKGTQLKGQINSIVTIQFRDTFFQGYVDEAQTIPSPSSFERLKDVVITSFNTVNRTNVIGVILFEDNIMHSRFVRNPHQDIEEKVLNRINEVFPNSIRE